MENNNKNSTIIILKKTTFVGCGGGPTVSTQNIGPGGHTIKKIRVVDIETVRC